MLPPLRAGTVRKRLGGLRSRSSRSFLAVETHTSGEPTRIILDGSPSQAWANAAEARHELSRRHDWLRRVASFEPRGHRGMFAAALVSVERPETPWGIVFLCPDGYPDMCGHATIGVATALVELGFVEAEGDEVVSTALDTPGGLVALRIETRDGRAGPVTFRNQPAFLLERVTIEAPRGAPVDVAIAWGGQWYAFLDAAPFRLQVNMAEIDRLVAQAEDVRAQIRSRMTRPDPRDGVGVRVGNIVWLGEPAPGADSRSVPVSRAGAFDRSPCGTGTSARLAVLEAEGRLGIGQRFVSEGILGTRFEARIVERTEVAGVSAVVPEVSGQAWIAGVAEYWVDPDDPLGDGFLPG